MTVAIVNICKQLVSAAIEYRYKLGDNSSMYDNALEELLKGSPICGLLPAILKAISDIASSCGLKILQHHMEKVTELIDSVTDCHKSINTFIVNLPVSKCLFDDIAPKKTVASQVVESEHPYRSNMDEYRLVSFPGAFKIVIVFDPTSRTENGCDFVHFLDLQKKKLEGTGTYDGRDGSEVNL